MLKGAQNLAETPKTNSSARAYPRRGLAYLQCRRGLCRSNENVDIPHGLLEPVLNRQHRERCALI